MYQKLGQGQAANGTVVNWVEIFVGGGLITGLVEIVRSLFQRKKVDGDYAGQLAQAAANMVGPMGTRLAHVEAMLNARDDRIDTLTGQLREALTTIEYLRDENQELQREVASLRGELNRITGGGVAGA